MIHSIPMPMTKNMRTKTKIELELPIIIEGVEFSRIGVDDILPSKPWSRRFAPLSVFGSRRLRRERP
jgi:hypothetical protein